MAPTRRRFLMCYRDLVPRTFDTRRRVLILGMCPLPTDDENQTLGPGKRTWQFTKAMLDAQCHVCLVTSRHPAAYAEQRLPPIMAKQRGELIHYSVTQRVFETPDWLQSIHDHFQPDCLVGATVFPSAIACRLKTPKPVWADLFGHTMAEAQTKCQVFNDDFYFFQYWRNEQQVLDRADAFSVVSNPQRFATLGELGVRGRLNRFTTSFPFVSVIPCSFFGADDDVKSDRIMRGREVNEDDFVILWSGGYNTWTDVDTLFAALETMMAQNPRIRFLSTGGEIGGHDEITYPRFMNMVNHSQFRDRFIMKGWIPHHLLRTYWNEVDIAINVDKFSYEALLGSRNRILDWMGAQLPILTSRVCELTQIMEKERLGLTFSPENATELSQLISWAAEHQGELKEMAHRAKIYALGHYSIPVTTAPLAAWINHPACAPDRERRELLPLKLRDLPWRKRGHYLASLRNQLVSQGLAKTAQWVVKRTFRSHD